LILGCFAIGIFLGAFHWWLLGKWKPFFGTTLVVALTFLVCSLLMSLELLLFQIGAISLIVGFWTGIILAIKSPRLRGEEER